MKPEDIKRMPENEIDGRSARARPRRMGWVGSAPAASSAWTTPPRRSACCGA